MRCKLMYLVLFLFMGISLHAQPPYVIGQAADAVPVAHDDARRCATIMNVQQECNDNGQVEITFNIQNNTNQTVNYIRIIGMGGNTLADIFPLMLPPGAVTAATVTLTAQPGKSICFYVKMYSTEGKVCCYERHCITAIECPCAEIGRMRIDCDNNGGYDFCFEVVNPAYSSNTINQISLFSDYPNLCVNGTPSPFFTIPPIAPGSSAIVCVNLSDCSGASIPDGVVINFTAFLEDSTDPAYCCHVDLDPVTTPCCIVDDCSQFTFTANHNTQGGNNFTTTIISGVSATVTFSFHTQGVPDQLIVTSNGGNINTGPWSTTGSSGCGGIAAQGVFTGSINVAPCDVVTITVLGNVCNVGGTGWTLTVGCNSGPLPLPDYMLSQAQSAESGQASETKREAQPNTGSLDIFPNPVRDIITIRDNDDAVDYNEVAIMDASGRTVLTDDMSGDSEVKMDVSRLPLGTYFMQIIDVNGNVTTDKFIKIQ